MRSIRRLDPIYTGLHSGLRHWAKSVKNTSVHCTVYTQSVRVHKPTFNPLTSAGPLPSPLPNDFWGYMKTVKIHQGCVQLHTSYYTVGWVPLNKTFLCFSNKCVCVWLNPCFMSLLSYPFRLGHAKWIICPMIAVLLDRTLPQLVIY